MGKELVETFEKQVSLESRRPDLTINRPLTAKDGYACIKGDVMGVITASSLLRRRTRSTVGGTAFSTASDAGSVVDSGVFKAGDVLKVLTAVKQQETFTVIGTVDADGVGALDVTVTGALIPGGSKIITVNVANNDTASQVAAKIRVKLAADGDVNDAYSVSGSGADGVLETLVAAAYDSTLNVAIAEGTSDGLTAAPTSVNTTRGNAVAATIGTVESVVVAGEDGDAITLTGNAAVNAAEDSVVVGSDGSQVAAVIAEDGSDGVGDTPINVIVSSPAINTSLLRGLDDSAIEELGGKVVLGEMKF